MEISRFILSTTLVIFTLMNRLSADEEFRKGYVYYHVNKPQLVYSDPADAELQHVGSSQNRGVKFDGDVYYVDNADLTPEIPNPGHGGQFQHPQLQYAAAPQLVPVPHHQPVAFGPGPNQPLLPLTDFYSRRKRRFNNQYQQRHY